MVFSTIFAVAIGLVSDMINLFESHCFTFKQEQIYTVKILWMSAVHGAEDNAEYTLE